MWTCRKCHQRWNGNKLRCTCGRARPKQRLTHKQILKDMPYELWVDRYGDRCNICGAAAGTRRLHRDHDHATGESRGVLCFRCNAALRGYMTASWLRDAADYLDRAANLETTV